MVILKRRNTPNGENMIIPDQIVPKSKSFIHWISWRITKWTAKILAGMLVENYFFR